MWCRAVLVLLAGTLTSTNTFAATITTTQIPTTTSTPNATLLKAGRAINLFSRYGYLSISMRVVPRNDSDQTWIFREPTVDIFNNIDYLIKNRKTNSLNNKKSLIFDGDFHMEFCDNLRQLLQAYFRDFTFEKLDKPWRAFTSSWVPEIMARNLGINASFIGGNRGYVLVRVSRFRDSVKLGPLSPTVNIIDAVNDEINSIVVGDPSTVAQFIRKFGSHYISSYVTGNSLYQVFVYSKKVYTRIKQRLKEQSISELSNTELSNYFSPWYAEFMGHIKVASGNLTTEAWAESKLRVQYYVYSYTSLLKLRGNAALLRDLNEQLGNEALLQIDLKTITPAFKDPAKKEWFEEVLDNYLKLWEVNM